MSTEVLKGTPYTSKCDVWAVGVIFYEMLHSKTPWLAKTAYELVKKIESVPFSVDEKLSPLTKHFIVKSLQA
jgi:serine/threonine protein kinase